jgi:hypothetical protein
MTNVGVRYQDDQLSEKMLPCITTCPMNAYKSPGFHFTIEAFYNQTYNIDEIFYEKEKWLENSNFSIEEVKSLTYGRCYMVCLSTKMPKKYGAYFKFWKFRDIRG